MNFKVGDQVFDTLNELFAEVIYYKDNNTLYVIYNNSGVGAFIPVNQLSYLY